MVTFNLSTSPPSLTPFTLSQSLTSVVQVISTHLPHHHSKILYHTAHTSTPHTHPMFILVADSDRIKYCFEFTPLSQYLVSITYLLPDHSSFLHVTGTTDECLKCPISVDDVKRVCGDPLSCHGDGSTKLALVFSESCFMFENRDGFLVLSRIKIGLTGSTRIITPQTHLMVDSVSRRAVGVCITSEHNERALRVYLQSHYQDVAGELGSASEVFYREAEGKPPAMILSYVHLGLDVVMDIISDQVIKIVLHTNTADHHEFCCYSRCFFQFSFTKDSLSADYESCDNLLVTPVTNWSAVKLYVDPSQETVIGKLQYHPSTNCTYPFPSTSLHVLFDQLVCEVTDTKAIATVTLLSCDSHVTNQYESPKPVFHPPTHFREVTHSYLRSCSLTSEEFYDCGEDSFHSASSSLVGGGDSQTTPSSEPASTANKTVGEHKVVVGPNVNVVVCRKVPTMASSAGHVCLLYQFLDSSHMEHTVTDHAEHTITDHTDYTTVYTSDTLKILACSSEQLVSDLSLLSSDEEDLQSFEMVSLDSVQSGQSENGATPGEKDTIMEHKEPEFIYQPKSTSVPSMVSSRILTVSQRESSSTKQMESRSRLLGHTKSSQQRVREKYKKEDPSPEEALKVGGFPPESEVSLWSEGNSPPEGATHRQSVGETPSPTTTPLMSESVISNSDNQMVFLAAAPVSESSNKDYKALAIAGDTPAQGTMVSSSGDKDQEAVSVRDSPQLYQDTSQLRVAGEEEDGTWSLSATTAGLRENTHTMDSRENTHTADLRENAHTVDSKENAHTADLRENAHTADLRENAHTADLRENTHTADSESILVPDDTGVVPSEAVVGVARAQWEEGEYRPETGPPSITPERVVEELIACEHDEVKSTLQERLWTLQSVKELLHSDPNRTAQLEAFLSQDESLTDAIVASLNKNQSWSLASSATLLPFLQNLFSTDSQRSRTLQAAQAVLCVADQHTALLVRHKLGRARSLSVLQRKQCIKCYVTLEKIDELADILIRTLSDKQLTPDKQELLYKLKEVRTALAKILKKIDLA